MLPWRRGLYSVQMCIRDRLLGIAKLFSEKTEQLKGTLVCIFQHAEEVPPGGAIEMVRAGVMEGVDEIYGIHPVSYTHLDVYKRQAFYGVQRTSV